MHGKLTTTVTSHRQQTSFPITSRAKLRCRIRTVSKRKQEQKNCREDGDSDIVAKVLEKNRRKKAWSDRPSKNDLHGARIWRFTLGLDYSLARSVPMIFFNRYPQANSMDRLGALIRRSKAFLTFLLSGADHESIHVYHEI
jgi:hypothetical protein